MNSKGINIKIAFEVLSLVLILTVISLVMIYSSFEKGIVDFWEKNKEVSTLIQDSLSDDIVNLDGVSKKDILVKEYIETKGDVDVFSELFGEYSEENKNEKP